MRRGDRLVWRWAAVAAVGVALLVVAALAVRAASERRSAEMLAAADAAAAAVADARAADAMRWAPAELAAAERAARDALTGQRVEQERAWLIPDSTPIVAAWSAAERAARRASELARRRHADRADSAAEQIASARLAVAGSEAVAATVHLGSARRLLSRARSLLTEALAYQRAGELGTAAARAQEASVLAGQVSEHAAALTARYADAETVGRWQRWKSQTIDWSRREGRAAIVVVKDAHVMTLYVRGEPVKRYTVELGFNWIADKRQEGDGSTPEGRYRVTARLDRPSSDYYKALLLDYPNAEDRARFSRARRSGGLPGSARIGGLIEIHGSGGRGHDWTNGCVAVTNPEMDDLFRRVSVGTPVTIVGSDRYGPIAEFVRQTRQQAADDRD